MNIRSGIGLILFSLLLSACSSGYSSLAPVQSMPEEFSKSGSAEIRGRWWESLDDPMLNELMEEALSKNFSVRAAWNRLQEARAISDREFAPLFPDLTLSGNVEKVDRGKNEFNSGEGDEETSLGLLSSYELDLWGRVRARARAEGFREEAEQADYRTATLSLSAEIARAWFSLLAVKERLKVLQKQFQANTDAVTILKAQFGNGQVKQADILRQQRLLEATREETVVAELAQRRLEHRLAVLLGRAPQIGISYEESSLPRSLPELPKTGLPAELLQRRPDLQAAFLRLKAADEDVAAAVRDRYPKITLSASLSTEDADENKLFEDWLNRLAADLFLPVIDFGGRRAEVRRFEALRQQRFYEYGQASLEALQEVEDALIREEKQKERMKSIRSQVDLTERSFTLVRRDYLYGNGNYLDALQALADLQELRRELVSEQYSLIEARIQLYRALAGAFENELDDSAEAQKAA